MATPKKNQNIPVLSENLLDDETTSGEALTPGLKALYAEMGMEGEVDATVFVYLLPIDGKGLEAGVWKGTPDEYDLEGIARRFGSGQYRVKVYVRNTDGAKPLKANRVFGWKLAADDERKLKEAAEPKTPQAAESINLKEILEGIAATVATAVKAAVPEQAKAPTRKEMLEEMQLMSQMFRPEKSSNEDSFSKRLGEFKMFQEVMKGLTPDRLLDPDGKIDSGALMMKALDVFGDTVKAARNGKLPAPLPVGNESVTVLPASVGGNPAVVAGSDHIVMSEDEMKAEAQRELEEAVMLLKLQLKAAIAMAKVNAEPAAFADSIYDMLPDEAIAILQNDAAWMDKLAEINPDVKQHTEWFSKLRGEILKLEAENNPPDNSAPDAG